MPAETTILIVDDEAHLRMLIQQSLEELEDLGVRLLTANDGQQALQIASAERPAVIFMDLMMPRLNGFEACQQIKRLPGLAGIFIVILTARGHEVDRQRGSQAGADAYLTKPFDPGELLALAKEALHLSD